MPRRRRCSTRARAFRSLEDVLVGLVDDLDALPGPTMIALDDYHVVDALEVHEAVAVLLDNLPPAGHPRDGDTRRPALPAAAAPRRATSCVELRAADLRFTQAEAGVPHRGHGPRARARADGAPRSQRAPRAGRPACSSPGSSLRGPEADFGGVVVAFAGSHRFVDYLVEEVLDDQPEDVRRFLLADLDPGRAVRPAVRRRDRPTPTASVLEPLDGRTCSSSRSTSSGRGGATTTCSPRRCAHG